jgi:hypoxanthine phosphoribosyltransferase
MIEESLGRKAQQAVSHLEGLSSKEEAKFSRWFRVRLLRLSWEQVEKACRTISKKILRSNYKPDICLAISRGGLIPARLMCDLLDLRDLACIKVEYYSGIDKTLSEPMIVYPLNAIVRNKRVLVVDDVADRGDTLILVRKNAEESGAIETRLATLHYKPWSKVKPDYYARELRSWIVYPWEVLEIARGILLDLKQKGASSREARRQIEKIGMTGNEIRTALTDFTP